MHGERYPDATSALAAVDQLRDRNRQLEAENEALREALRLAAEERGRLEIDLKGLRAEHD